MSGISPLTTLMQRLMSKAEKTPSGCIEWRGDTLNGYGRMRYLGKRQFTHRLSWIAHHGGIPQGICVLHRCDNPLCINPKHLFLGTRHDNNVDKTLKGRQARGVGHGKSGEDNHFSKITTAHVQAIRDSYALGRLTQSEIATQYGISQSQVSNIVTKKHWRHHGIS